VLLGVIPTEDAAGRMSQTPLLNLPTLMAQHGDNQLPGGSGGIAPRRRNPDQAILPGVGIEVEEPGLAADQRSPQPFSPHSSSSALGRTLPRSTPTEAIWARPPCPFPATHSRPPSRARRWCSTPMASDRCRRRWSADRRRSREPYRRLPAIKIGSIAATVTFGGLVGPGELQFNVVVPASLADGDQPITATYNGLTTQSGTLIAVHR
jgi:hypothetical protein